jgi:quinol monooxygenase YgiN
MTPSPPTCNRSAQSPGSGRVFVPGEPQMSSAAQRRLHDDPPEPPRGAFVIIVAGALYVAADARDGYLAGCRAVVENARTTPGCIDFALSPDIVDARRINVLERWTTTEALQQFRGSGPSDEQNDALQHADVQEFQLA